MGRIFDHFCAAAIGRQSGRMNILRHLPASVCSGLHEDVRMLVCFAYLHPLVGLRKGEGRREPTMAFRRAKVRPYVEYGLALARADSIQMNRVVGAAWIAAPAPLWPILAWPPRPSPTMAMATAAGQNMANKESQLIEISYRLLICHKDGLVSLLELYPTMKANSNFWPWPTLSGGRLSLPARFKI